ncbi:hypothetical protein Tco_0198837 [Tanacetum coccineum]
MADLQLPDKGAQRGELEGVGAGSQERPFKPAPLAQTTHSSVFIKENIKVLRRMIKEHYQQAKTMGTLKKLAYDESEEGDSASRKTMSQARRSERLQGRNKSWEKTKKERAKSKGGRPKHQETSSDSESEDDPKYNYEDLSTPYKRPKPTPFMTRITRFKYYQRAKLPRNIKVHEGNKYPEDHLSIFSTATELEEWSMPVWCKMFRQTLGGAYAKDPMEIHGIKRRQNEGLQAFMDRFKFESSHIKGVPIVLRISTFMHSHGHSERAKKLNDEIPKTVDEMFERVPAFIRGEIAAGSAEATRPPQWDKVSTRTSWFKGHERVRGSSGPREFQRNMGTCALYPRRDTLTPLTKTSEEILAMESIGFPPPPPLIEEVMASEKLVHLMKDIRRGNQRNRGQGRGNLKVINMVNAGGSRKRPYETGRPRLKEEITFPPIPQNSLTDGPIILEYWKGQLKVTRFGRSQGNHGRARKEQNCATRIYDSEMSLAPQRDNGKNRHEE